MPARLSIIPAAAVDDNELSPLQFRILACLGTYLDADHNCYPKRTTIAERVGCKPRAVTTALSALRDAGYITIKPQFLPDGRQTSSLVHVDLNPLASGNHPPSSPETTPPSTQEPALEDIQDNGSEDKTSLSASQLADALAEYNRACEVLKAKFGEQRWYGAKALNGQRKTWMTARLKDLASEGDNWTDFLRRCLNSQFLTGQTHHNFKVRIDWLLKLSNFTKIMEGHYDRTNNRPSPDEPDIRNPFAKQLLRAADDELDGAGPGACDDAAGGYPIDAGEGHSATLLV